MYKKDCPNLSNFSLGVDYGVIPGAKKPTLLKGGAEKLCKLFGLRASYGVCIAEEKFWSVEDFLVETVPLTVIGY